ncbi:MAG TPA: M81 family metallopeptidase [Casimicrobiaceae bacterium]|nr:M81 family metallopeptidase [Casimicrobiaceae bacterium]
MPARSSQRVALLGLLLESNSFAPPTVRDDYLRRVYVAGDEILAELGKADSRLPAEVLGFRSAMDAACEWTPLPILIGLVEAGGPLDHEFYRTTLAEMRRRLEAAMPLDAVYIANHGAMITTATRDPDGEIFAMVRAVVGPDVPIVATLDLHGNVSQAMVDNVNLIAAYRTNPHVDMFDRGVEVARALVEMLRGLRPQAVLLRLPLAPPTVTLRTECGPYADLMAYGQSRIGGEILGVSILGGFAYADTEKNGLAIIVTARSDRKAAARVARDIAARAWADHLRYVPALTSLDDAVATVLQVCRDPSRRPVILADVADNPGGGGRGNTTWILEALQRAGATGVLIGVFNDPELAAQAHALGEGAEFDAVFNRAESDPRSLRFEAHARVLRLRDGDCVGRRGFYAGRRMNLGPSALLDLGGIRIAVISIRTQCADPVFLEMFGEDIASARAVVVKSRGHFRAGFDEFFDDSQVIEVDAPGLTSPILSRFDFKHLPRPIFPVDTEVEWVAPQGDL